MYYNYHNRLKQLLQTEQYICVEETGKFAYRFIFPRIMKSMPIREYKVNEYLEYIRRIKMKHITLKEMFDILIDCILKQKEEYPTFYYKRQNWNTGNDEFIEITEVDLLYGRFNTIDGDFSEFEWELKDSNIYIKEE